MRIKFWFLSILLVLSLMPVGHMIVMLLREVIDVTQWVIAHLALGLIGIYVIHQGNKQTGKNASILGFFGAHLIFIGFFEFAFAFVANVLNIEPILHPKSQEVLLAPSLQVVELSGLILFPLLLLLGVSSQVRCNMMLWIRTKLRINITINEGQQSRPFASISANETLFVIWTIYVVSLLCLDPRVLGPTHWLSMFIYTAFMLWPFYLIYRIRRFTANGYIFRYSIPIGVLLWSWVEMLSSMNIIKEYFLYPHEYPIANLLTVFMAAALSIWALTAKENNTRRAVSH